MMLGSDNSSDARKLLFRIWVCLSCLTFCAACNRMITPQNAQLVRDADAKAAEGKFVNAIGLYESALDGTTRSAEIHYRLALLYDDKMNDPLNALHHFKRYLTLAPDGSHATDAKNFMKRDELALLTNLSGDTVVPRAEASRLRNENLALRKELEDQRALAHNTTAENRKPHEKRAEKTTADTRKSGAHARTYVVKPGDTLASISRKFYKSSARWKEIRNANAEKIADPQNLKIGETLTIP
jgi:tetratricopeptide (TPR) repeat protein